jgi:hypothetical protein
MDELIKEVGCGNINAVSYFWTSIEKDGAPLNENIMAYNRMRGGNLHAFCYIY